MCIRDRLTNAIKRVLRYAIRKGGTTLKDFYSADGSEGYFNLNLNVYDREDENCKNCKSKNKKSSYWTKSFILL